MRHRRTLFHRLVIAAFGAIATISHTAAIANDTPLRLAWFRADVTVPIGHRLMGILPAKAARVADPLEARGFVVLGADAPIVWVAVDWCEIRNEAYDRWREVLAAAAGTEPSRVLVTSLHQHDAPVADLGAQRLLDERGIAQRALRSRNSMRMPSSASRTRSANASPRRGASRMSALVGARCMTLPPIAGSSSHRGRWNFHAAATRAATQRCATLRKGLSILGCGPSAFGTASNRSWPFMHMLHTR